MWLTTSLSDCICSLGLFFPFFVLEVWSLSAGMGHVLGFFLGCLLFPAALMPSWPTECSMQLHFTTETPLMKAPCTMGWTAMTPNLFVSCLVTLAVLSKHKPPSCMVTVAMCKAMRGGLLQPRNELDVIAMHFNCLTGQLSVNSWHYGCLMLMFHFFPHSIFPPEPDDNVWRLMVSFFKELVYSTGLPIPSASTEKNLWLVYSYLNWQLLSDLQHWATPFSGSVFGWHEKKLPVPSNWQKRWVIAEYSS